MNDPTHSTFEADLRELARIKRLQQVLEVPAHIFATTTPGCEGACEKPTYILLPNGMQMPCCAFRVSYELKASARALEKQVQRRVDLALHEVPSKSTTRKALISGLALSRAMPRDFTGTAAARRRDLLSPEHEAGVVRHEGEKRRGPPRST